LLLSLSELNVIRIPSHNPEMIVLHISRIEATNYICLRFTGPFLSCNEVIVCSKHEDLKKLNSKGRNKNPRGAWEVVGLQTLGHVTCGDS
jgi:hypothetical protein